MKPGWIKTLRPETAAFLLLLGITALIWLLRGLSLLSFLPGMILWVLIFLTVGAGVIAALQATRW